MDLGLTRSRAGVPVITEIRCSGTLVFPLVNTLHPAEALHVAGCTSNWKSLRLAFGSVEAWTCFPTWPGSAVAWVLAGTGTAQLLQKRLDREVHVGPLSSTPRWFDPSVPFQLQLEGSARPVSIAFQHSSRDSLSAKTLGRLKALGCSVDDPAAWVPPRRYPLVLSQVQSGASLYIGGGSNLVKGSGARPGLG